MYNCTSESVVPQEFASLGRPRHRAAPTRLLVIGVLAGALLFGFGGFTHTTSHIALSAHGPSVALVKPPKPGCSGSVTPCGATS